VFILQNEFEGISTWIKIKVEVLGSGNIGTDLMINLGGSTVLELTTVIGIDPDFDGLRKARTLEYETIDNGIDGILVRP
jgi:acetaldehyde dehydrogenase (acetylating)